MVDASDVRGVIAHEPTIGQSIVALVRAIANAASRALDHEDPGLLRDMATSMADDTRSWADAVLANTQLATESASIDHGPIRVPAGHIAEVFAKPATSSQAQADADAEAERQRLAAVGIERIVPPADARTQADRNQAAADIQAGQVGVQAANPYAGQAATADSGAVKTGGGAIHF